MQPSLNRRPPNLNLSQMQQQQQQQQQQGGQRSSSTTPRSMGGNMTPTSATGRRSSIVGNFRALETATDSPMARAGRPALMTDVLQLEEQEETAGLYGLGINVNMRFPHTVRSSSGLQDATGKSIADSVAVHDTLTHVDEVPLEGQTDALTSFILGPKDTVVTLQFENKHGGTYVVRARRHTEFKTWARQLKNYTIKPEAKDKEFRTDANLIMALEHARNEFVHGYFNMSEKMAMESKQMVHGVERTLGKLDHAMMLVGNIPDAKTNIQEAIYEIAAAEHHREEQEQEVMKMLETLEVSVEDELNRAEATVHISDKEGIMSRLRDLEVENDRLRKLLEEMTAEMNMWKRRALTAEPQIPHLEVAKATLSAEVEEEQKGRREDKVQAERREGELQALVAKLREQVDSAERERDTMKKQRDAFEEKYDALKRGYDEVVRDRDDARAKRDVLVVNLGVVTEDRDAAKRDIVVLQEELNSLRRKLEEAQADRDDARTRRDALAVSLGDMTEERDTVKRELTVVSDELDSMKRKLDMAQQELQQSVAKANVLRSERDGATSARDQAKRELKEATEQVEALTRQLETACSERDAACAKRDRFKAEWESASSDRDAARRELESLQLSKEHVDKQLAECSSERDDAVSKRDAFKEARDIAAGERDQLQKGYEAALHDKEQVSKRLGEAAKERDAAKAALSSAIEAQKVATASLKEAKDENRKLAAEVAKLKQELQNHVPRPDLLASQSEARESKEEAKILATSLASAQKRIKELEIAVKKAAKTEEELRGELEGTVARSEYDSVLSKLQNAQADADSRAQQISSLDSKLAEARESVSALHESNVKINAELDRLRLEAATLVPRSELLEAQSQLKAKSSELEASLKSIKELEAKVDRLEKTLAESKATEAKLRAQLEGMVPRTELLQAQSQVTIAQDDAASSKRTAQMYEKRCDELRDEVKTASDEVARLTALLQDMVSKSDLDKVTAELKTWQQKCEGLGAQLDAARDDISKLKAELDRLRMERDDLVRKLGDSVPRIDYDRERDSNTKATQRVRDLEEELRKLRAGLGDSEGSAAAAALEIAKLRDQLASALAEIKSLNEQIESLRKQLEHAQAHAKAMQKKAEGMEGECQSLNEWLKQKEAALKAALEEIERLKTHASMLIDQDTLDGIKAKIDRLQKELQNVIEELRACQKALDEERRENARLRARYGVTPPAEKKHDQIHLGFVSVDVTPRGTKGNSTWA